MGLLNLKRKKKEEPEGKVLKLAKKLPVMEKTEKLAIKAVSKVLPLGSGKHAFVLLHPRITEKASFLVEKSNVYTFEVSSRAGERAVARAVEELYNVRPVKVAILPIRRKQVIVRGKVGMRKGGRKAYVYLKKGDKIETI